MTESIATAALSGTPFPLPARGTAADVTACIGSTPLIRLGALSERTGCEILGKAEFMNPGGSLKDRAALGIVEAAEADGSLRPGGVICEGTAGNTGIGLALVAGARGYRTAIIIPETQTEEKKQSLRMAGAELIEVPAVPYRDPNNYVHVSERLAVHLGAELPAGAIWARQFDNTANAAFHERTTGPEIWAQTGGRIDSFVASVGTGGTIAGVSRALKARSESVRVVVADPPGSALHSWVQTGELMAEGSSITEGIGQGRVTGNLARARIDDSYQIPDSEAVPLIFELIGTEGLVMGPSTGTNLAGALREAERLGPGHTIVTVLCDQGARYRSKLFDPERLRGFGLPVPTWLEGGGALPVSRAALLSTG